MVRSGAATGADLEAASSPQVIKVLVKTPRQQEEFVVSHDRLIQEFKEGVSTRFCNPTDRLVLIFAGRILKDHKTLGQHGIHDEATIHLVIQSQRRPLDSAGQHAGSEGGCDVIHADNINLSRPDSASSTDSGTNDLQELIRNLGLNTANFSEFQSQLMSNPEMMLRLLENPFIQSRLANPNLMSELITDNPLKQQVIQKIPEISHVLNTPEMLKLMLELAQSPATVREIMENPSQALSFLASIVGRSNTSAQVCSDPLDGAPVQTGGKPLACLRSNQTPMDTRTPSPQPCTSPSSPHLSSSSSFSDRMAQSSHGADPELERPAGTAVSAAIKSSLQQIIKQLVQNILPVPSMRSLQRSLNQNPHRGAQMLLQSPTTPGKPPMQSIPAFHQQIWHPEGQAAMPSPREMQTLAQVQQRLQALAMGEPAVPPQFLSPLAGLGHTGGSAERAASNSGLPEVTHPASGARSQQFRCYRH